MHLIMPMGGAGTRFFNNGFDCPKPLLPLQDKPFFYWSARSILKTCPVESLTFVVLREHIERFAIDRKILSFFPGAKIVSLPQVLPGAVLTCLEGVKALPVEASVIFNDCDHAFSSQALGQFLRGKDSSDGALLTFRSREPKFSYLAYDERGNVCKTVEKVVISEDAICGAYYFRRVGDFRKNAARYLENCTYQEFFLSGVYNELIRAGGKVRGLPVDFHLPFGTPEEYSEAENSGLLKELI